MLFEFASNSALSRLAQIDNGKGVAAIAVVFGHGTELAWKSHSKKLSPYPIYSWPLFSFIYSWHMPLFIMLSGYVFSRSPFSGRRGVVGLLTLLLAYIVFSTFRWIMDPRLIGPAFSRRGKNGYNWPWDLTDFHWDLFLRPAYWYLLTMFYYRIAFCWLPGLAARTSSDRVGRGKAVASGVGIVAGTVLVVLFFLRNFTVDPHNFLAIVRSFSFSPFFVIGCLARHRKWKMPRSVWVKRAAWCVLLMPLVLYLYAPSFEEWMDHKTNYHNFWVSARTFAEFTLENDDGTEWTFNDKSLCRVGTWMWSLLYCTAIMAAVPTEVSHPLTDLGIGSLAVYITHTIFLQEFGWEWMDDFRSIRIHRLQWYILWCSLGVLCCGLGPIAAIVTKSFQKMSKLCDLLVGLTLPKKPSADAISASEVLEEGRLELSSAEVAN